MTRLSAAASAVDSMCAFSFGQLAKP